MPHVVLEGPHDLDKSLRACTPKTWSEAQQEVKVSTTLLRMYREVTADSWPVEMVVKEGRLSQHIVVAIVARSPWAFRVQHEGWSVRSGT